MTDLTRVIRARLDAINDSGRLDSCRLLHGRGGCFTGLEQVAVDFFWPVVLLTFFKRPLRVDFESAVEQQVIAAIERSRLSAPVSAIAVQRRYLPTTPLDCIYGELPTGLFARRGDLRFELRLQEGQNSGFFLDMEPGRQWLEALAAGRRVVNLFAYTCAFSVVAKSAAASSVVNVDMNSAALQRGRDNHHLNRQSTDGVHFLRQNILKSWGRIRRAGPFDVAILDPPSYQPGSFVAARDYVKLVRRIPQFMSPGGDMLLCLNAPELSASFLQDLMWQHCPAGLFISRLQPADDFPDSDHNRGLKLLHYRYEPK